MQARKELAALQSVGELSYNFDSTTTEAELKVTKTDPYFLKHGTASQRFDQED